MSDESFLKNLDTDLSSGRVRPDDVRGIIHAPKMKPVADHWNPEPLPPEEDPYEKIMKKRKQQQSFFKKLFIFSVLFVMVAGGVFVYSLFNGKARLSGDHIQVDVSVKPFADSGEELSVQVRMINQNPVPVENARLILKYPTGNARNPDATRDINRDLGILNPGEVRDELFTINLYGEQGTVKNITALVEYRITGSTAIFEKTTQAPVELRSAIASLVVQAPPGTLSGQVVPFRITASGNSSSVVKNTIIIAEYPDGCTYQNADRQPTYDGNIWVLGDLQPGTQQEFTVNLFCSGLVNTEKAVRFSLGSQDPQNERLMESVYTTVLSAVAINETFLATELFVNGVRFSETTAVQPGSDVTFTIRWKNTLSEPINNAVVRMSIDGNAVNLNRLQANNGFYDSNNRIILWTGNEVTQFRSVQPGQEGELIVRVGVLSGLGATAKINTSISIEGFIRGGQQESVNNVIVASIPVSTEVQFVTESLHYSGPIQNSGAMPPKVGQKTTYTVSWKLSNSANILNTAQVKTTLPTGLSWENVVVPSAESGRLQYNSVTREIVWNIGDLPVGQDIRTVAFKVGVTPVMTNIGSVVNLTSDIQLTAFDSVTRTTVNQTKRPVTTRTNVDTIMTGANGIVVQ